jgi:hypothetical protein
MTENFTMVTKKNFQAMTKKFQLLDLMIKDFQAVTEFYK